MALGDDAPKSWTGAEARALWKNSCLRTPIRAKQNQNPIAEKGRGGMKVFFFPFYLALKGASQMFHPFVSTSTSRFLLGVDFIPQQMDGRIRSRPHNTRLLPSLWIQSTKSILLTSAPVHTWHFLQFSRRHQKHQLAARKWKGATDGVW